MTRIKRVYHHHDKCEEYAAGMWRTITGELKEHYAQATAGLMADPVKFKSAMLRALKEWPNSCEMNLSAQPINRQAWMGHAGCYLGTCRPDTPEYEKGSSEEATRLGWHRLTEEEQATANRMADEVIAEWERRQMAKQDGGSQMLLGVSA